GVVSLLFRVVLDDHYGVHRGFRVGRAVSGSTRLPDSDTAANRPLDHVSGQGDGPWFVRGRVSVRRQLFFGAHVARDRWWQGPARGDGSPPCHGDAERPVRGAGYGYGAGSARRPASGGGV